MTIPLIWSIRGITDGNKNHGYALCPFARFPVENKSDILPPLTGSTGSTGSTGKPKKNPAADRAAGFFLEVNSAIL
jgi:hypothetical protein